MKNFLALLVTVTIVALLGFWWYSTEILPANSANSTKVSFIVAQAEPASQVVTDLAARGLIKSAFVGKIYLRLSGIGPKIQAGSYMISADEPMQTILFELTSGPADVWVTIPEGFRREQIADRLTAKLAGPNGQFDSASFVIKTASLEGRLFPDTYLIPASATADQIITMLTANFAKKVGNVTQDQLVLASLIEREAKADAERPIIAGIITTRLEAGAALDIDATIQYAMGTTRDWWPQVYSTKLASLFNTYLHAGLPPRAICNPGLPSIQAAQNPAKTDYWYYIHDAHGQAHFAKTLTEQSANVDKYLRPW